MQILCVLSWPNLAAVLFSHFVLLALSLCLFVCLKLRLNSDDEQRFDGSLWGLSLLQNLHVDLFP